MSRSLRIAALALLPFAAFAFFQTALAQNRGNTDRRASAILGFDMWCQEVETLAESRCDQHRPEDVKAYQAYRALMERFQEERDAKARKEREISESLNRDPLAASRDRARTGP